MAEAAIQAQCSSINMALAAFSRARRECADLEAILVTGPLFQDWANLEPVEGARFGSVRAGSGGPLWGGGACDVPGYPEKAVSMTNSPGPRTSRKGGQTLSSIVVPT